MKQKSILIILLLFCINSYGQSLKEFRFDKYPAKKTASATKTKINYNSHKIARQYKTAITENYKLSQINFAGYYIVSSWGCGAGCIDGAMVDTRDGKVYKVPMGETRNYTGCVFEDNEDCVEYSETSRLFITQICIQTKKTSENDVQEKEYFVNVWDEKKKKFILIKNFKINKLVKAD